MTEKEFLNKIANGKDDFLQSFVDILRKDKVRFCAIGGLAVNAYTEPVVSLDLDVVIVAENLKELVPKLKKYFKVESFASSINLSERDSALRIQIQTDMRYQSFIKRAKSKTVLGYRIPVASVEDVLQGKIWAAMDETLRPSKRQKDLADILRLVETKEYLKRIVPIKIRAQLRMD